MMVPWFEFGLSRALLRGIVIGLVLGVFLRTVILHS